MTNENNAKKKRLLAAITKAERDRDKLSDLSHGLSKRLAAIIARERGIVVGKRYRVMPRPGNAFTVTVKSIGNVMPYQAKTGGITVGELYISVLVYCERKNGHDVFRSEWLDTNRYEFYPVKDEEGAAEVAS